MASGQEPPKEKPDGEKPGGPMAGRPPAVVSTAPVRSGEIAPMAEFIGTVFYETMSRVASEAEGIVLEAPFEEGEKIRRGALMARLDSQMVENSLKSLQARLAEALAQLEKTRVDFARTEKLFQEKNISEQRYDDDRFAVLFQENRVNSLKTDIEGIQSDLAKKTITAPFDGVIIEKHAEVGQWVAKGGPLALVAENTALNIVAYLPQAILPWVEPGTAVSATAQGRTVNGRVLGVVPRGSVETRTFPVRLRVEEGAEDLIEGMEVRIFFPSGPRSRCLLTPRDAVILMKGQSVLFRVEEGKAVMTPVKVIGYNGADAGIESPALAEGAVVIVKGNERVQDGQPIVVTPSGGDTPGGGRP